MDHEANNGLTGRWRVISYQPMWAVGRAVRHTLHVRLEMPSRVSKKWGNCKEGKR